MDPTPFRKRFIPATVVKGAVRIHAKGAVTAAAKAIATAAVVPAPQAQSNPYRPCRLTSYYIVSNLT